MAAKSLADIAAQVTSSLVGRGCYFCLQVYLARTLGPASFGVFSLGLTVFTLMSGVAPFGMPQAVIRYEFRGSSVIFSTPMALGASIGIAGSVLIALFASRIGAAFNESQTAAIMIAMSPSVALLCVFGVLCAGLRSAGGNVSSASIDASFFVLYLGLSFVLFRYSQSRNPLLAAWSYDIALTFVTIAAICWCWRVPGAKPNVAVRPLVSFGFVTMIIHTVSMLNLQIDRVIIGVYAGGREVGLYQAATQIAVAAIVFRVAVLRVFEARIPKSEGDSRSELTREFIASTRVLIHISAPGLICVALAGAIWTKLLFGTAYLGASTPLAALVVGQLVQSFTGPSLTALHMTGGERTAMAITVSAFVVNTVGNLLLFPCFGLLGSALATAFASIVLGLASFLCIRANGRLGPVGYALFDVVLGTCAAAVPPLFAVHLECSSVRAIIIVTALSYALYSLTVMLLRRVEDEALDLAASASRHALAAWRKRKPRRLVRGA